MASAADSSGMSRSVRSGKRKAARTLAVLAGALLSLFHAPDAAAIVCADREAMPAPSNGYVGWWNGSSAVCIAPNWIISARHVGGEVGNLFWMRGQSYRSVEIVRHATQDIQLIRVAETLPGHHAIASGVQAGDLGILGGWGNTAGTAVAGGYDWSGAQAETWGANLIDNAGTLIVIDFDDLEADDSVAYESLFAVHDSGAGLFVYTGGGELQLAGVAVSVTGWNQTVVGNAAFCVNLHYLRGWIDQIVAPGHPIISSSTVAPRASMFDSGTHSMVWGAALFLGMACKRRRAVTA